MANVQGVRVCDECGSTIPAAEWHPSADGRDLCVRCTAAAQLAPPWPRASHAAVPGRAAMPAPAPSPPTRQTVIVRAPREKSVNGLGIAALVLGIVATLTCWVPFLGMVSLPLAGLGAAFALIGFLVAAIGRRSGVGMPISGGVVCLVAIVVQVLMTGGMVAALSERASSGSASVPKPPLARSRPATPAPAGGKAAADALAIRRDYLRQISLSQVRVDRTVLDELAVFGEITNNGRRTVANVSATIYCLNAEGRPVYEYPVYLVLAKPRGFSLRHDSPLRPGYSCKWGGFAMDNVPSSWAGGIRVELTDVEFMD